jgi:hypothetical protein
MTNTYKVLAWVTLVLILGLGLIVRGQSSTKLGDSLTSTIATHYLNGINVGTSDQFAIDGSGNVTQTGNQTTTGNESITGSQTAATFKTATVGISSSSPAALGSAASGHFVVAAGATTVGASTTAVTLNSDIAVQLEATTPIAGTTCNSSITVASSTPIITSKVAGNGFNMTIASAPLTNPFCYSYSITN